MRSHSLFCGGKGKRRPQHFYFDEKIRKKISLSKTLNNFLSLFKVSKEFSPLVCVCVCVSGTCKKQAAAFRLI